MLLAAADGEFFSPNPLAPAGYDIAWSLILVIIAAAVIAALVSIYRHRSQMSGIEIAVWVAVCLFVSIVGPAAWFAIGGRRIRDERAPTPT